MNLTLGGIHITIKSGAWIPILLMIPNLAWMLLPKADAGKQVSEPLVLTIIERVGLAAVLILPFFYSLDLQKKFSTPVAIGMGLMLAVYPAFAGLEYPAACPPGSLSPNVLGGDEHIPEQFGNMFDHGMGGLPRSLHR